MDLESIATEKRNENSTNIDKATTIDMLRIINEEDKKVAYAVEKVLPEVARAVDAIYEKLKGGGRLVYCGAGTSGRLGVLDATECPPTFGVNGDTVVALIAGGSAAFVKAIEGVEDSGEAGVSDLKAIDFSEADVLVGIAASGRTPYVIGAAEYARSLGATVIALTCTEKSELSEIADIEIAPLPGPEVVTGSTRLKSGTAQKLVLNMISTATMIKLGKVFGNLMVDVKATNVKLFERAKSIVSTVTGVTKEQAAEVLEKCEYSAKHAILMILCEAAYDQTRQALQECDGRISCAMQSLQHANKCE